MSKISMFVPSAWRLAAAGTLVGVTLMAAAPAQAALRQSVGTPLQQARDLLIAKKYKEALAKISEAEKAEASLTPEEQDIVNRLRAPAAQASGDYALALKTNELLLASGKLSEKEKQQTYQLNAGIAVKQQDNAKALDYIQKYQAAGGTDPQFLNMVPTLLYRTGKVGEATKLLEASLADQEKAGKTPDQKTLNNLAAMYAETKNQAGYVATLEKLIAYYPKGDFWKDLIARTVNADSFNRSRLALDTYRLRIQTSTMGGADEYVEAAQLAVQAKTPAEAANILKKGTDAGVLGKGGDADRENRLKDLVAKKVTEDKAGLVEVDKDIGNAPPDNIVNAGLAWVTHGEFDKGISLIQKGIAKGGLKRPDDAKLHLGYAYVLAGKKADAIAAFKTVKGTDGTAELARLWTLALR